MADPLISALIALQQQNTRNFTVLLGLYDTMTSTDTFWTRRRYNVPRVEHYVEITVANYTMEDFKSHFRLTRMTFESTYNRLCHLPEYNNTHGPIPDMQKDLLMFLWYIGNLESMRSISDRFGVSKSSFHKSMKRTASALLRLMPEVIKWPSTQAKVNSTCEGFGERSQFQTIIGAIDGCHIAINATRHSPHSYFNRKRFYSVVLLASCNANTEFNYVWTGDPGSTHDATVLRSSDLFQQSDEKMPLGYVLLLDSAFPILRWLITPFRDHGNLTREQKKFNKAHSSCRVVIERAFGLIKCRFCRLLRFEFGDFNVLVDSILAATVLHNLCVVGNEELDFPNEANCMNDNEDIFEREGHELQGIQVRQQMMQQLLNVQ